MVRPEGLKPPPYTLEECYAIQLHHEREFIYATLSSSPNHQMMNRMIAITTVAADMSFMMYILARVEQTTKQCQR